MTAAAKPKNTLLDRGLRLVMLMLEIQPASNMGELLYSGKVKQVWSTEDEDIIEFRYTDQISVFNQIIPSIPRKRESLNRASCRWFHYGGSDLQNTCGGDECPRSSAC